MKKSNARYTSSHINTVEEETVPACNFAPTPLGILKQTNHSFEILEDWAGEDQEDDTAAMDAVHKRMAQVKRPFHRRVRKGAQQDARSGLTLKDLARYK